MSLLTAVVSHLLADANVSAVVGSRIFPNEIPPGTSETPNSLPLLTYTLLDDPVQITHDRQSTYMARLQIDAWGGSYKSAHDSAAAVDASLHGFKGAMGSEGLHVGACFRKGKRDNNDAENVSLYRVELTFEAHYKE